MFRKVPSSVRPVYVLFLLATGGLVAGLTLSRAADHLDSPQVKTDGRIDITDVYAFQSPSDATHTVLIMNVNPIAGIVSPTTFHPEAAYQFKIDNDGDAIEDLTLTVRFEVADRHGVQPVTLVRTPARGGDSTMIAQGQTGQDIPVDGGGMLRCDVFDDPFFFDLDAFHRFQMTGDPGEFCKTPTNFFAGLNVSSIVLEVPSASLLSGAGSTAIGVWGRTVLNRVQMDRMGRPAVNTVLIPANLKDDFNARRPRNDKKRFRDTVLASLKALGNDDTRAGQLADFLLPDILTFDTAKVDGFPNGRRLEDDVIDIELNLLTNGVVKSDCVDNDSHFTATFPYLAPPN